MITLHELVSRTGLTVDNHLADAEIPVIDGPQCQGDLAIIPLTMVDGRVRVRPGADWAPVQRAGVEVLRGAAMGNAHTLVADPGTCRWTADVDDQDNLALGVLDTTATAYLLHREHGGTGIAPGCYVVRRQREQRDLIAYVAD
ncbi:hypothetical protein [Streptosporangium sp. CA-115845]|uniref:hypothetical protein n=1 Tax=Streptosporangium sp. CA-115845 TaxID=3240071 RepID=UPI003D937D51